MHIAFLTPEFPTITSTTTGGIGTSIYNLSYQLVEQGIDVTVILYSQQNAFEMRQEGITIIGIPFQKYAFGGWYFHRKYLEKCLNTLIKNRAIDVLEAPDWTGITAFMKLRCPIVIRLHGSDTYFCYLEERPQKWKNKWFEKRALKGASSIIAASDFTGKLTKQLFSISSPIRTFYNSINLSRFTPNHSVMQPNHIVYVGTVIRKKGILELATIFNYVIERVPSATLTIVGADVIDWKTNHSTYDLFSQRLSDTAKKNISYVGRVPYEEALHYLQKAHVVVFPSFAEAFPMVWLEAMALEKALVTSNIGWANEMISHEKDGLLVHPSDHVLFASQIVTLLKNSEMTMRLGKSARETITSKFSKDVIIQKTVQFYMSILK